MAVGAYMLSILKRQSLLLGPRFTRQHPHPWLVWEPGPWRPATTVLAGNNERTRHPDDAGPPRPAGEDAICFELVLQPGQSSLEVGRATSNDVVINDFTASRNQFTLTPTAAGWALTPSGGLVQLNHRHLAPGELAELAPGDQVVVGDVRLTYLDAEGLAARVQQAPASLLG